MRNKALSPEAIEEEYCHAIFIIEKELGHYIDDDYPIMKLREEMKELEWYRNQEKSNMEGL